MIRNIPSNKPGTRAAVIRVTVRDRMDTVVVVLHLSLSRVERNHKMYIVEKTKLKTVQMVNGIHPRIRIGNSFITLILHLFWKSYIFVLLFLTMIEYNHIPDAMTLIGVNIVIWYVTSSSQYFDILSFYFVGSNTTYIWYCISSYTCKRISLYIKFGAHVYIGSLKNKSKLIKYSVPPQRKDIT